MKRAILILLVMSFFNGLSAQCTLGSLYPWTFDSSTLSVSSRTEMICCLWGNEYMSISNIVASNTYTFDTCGPSGSFNSALTLFDPSNNSVAFNDGGCVVDGTAIITNFTPTISGTYRIQVNTTGCGAVAMNTPVSITLESTLGLVNNNDNLKLLVYPNPTSGGFVIETKTDVKTVLIYDISGAIVKKIDKDLSIYYIDELSSGVYFLNINTDNGNIIKKLIKE